ncbi:nitrite reductase large subunit NirB [Aquihabitans sp. McL0605]|uniref:nitrite reductase large subunit NirB n=1 Tax=Aquihabitans sp. McL0605 TaxID=3415671 RepID=UPI003CE69D8D
MPSAPGSPLRLVVIGNGMVGHRLLVSLAEAGATRAMAITVVGGETRPAYDRVGLSSWFAGRDAGALSLVEPGFFGDHGIRLLLGDPAVAIDREARTVTTASGEVLRYDRLVLATGSRPFVPPVPGHDGPGCFVYRTIDDLEAIAAAADRPSVRRGVVVGGGLLGLEAANALLQLGLETHVVEFAPRLMPVQLDEGGSATLLRHIERLGVQVHTSCATQAIENDGTQPTALAFDGREPLATDLVVFSAGIRPDDALARSASLDVGERGGVLVDDQLRTSDPAVLAVGECAVVAGRHFGLVAPGYQMARVAAVHLAAAAFGAPEPEDRFVGGDLSTKLKLLGVEVANVGSVHEAEGGHRLVWDDPVAGTYQRLDVDDGGRVRAAVLVGDSSAFGPILDRFRSGRALDDPGALLKPAPTGAVPAAADPSAGICSCENVSRGAVCGAIAEGCDTLKALKATTRAGTGCGGCVPILEGLLRTESATAATGLCEHFGHSRVELYDLIRVRRHATFAEVLDRYGVAPGGCEVCKPTVASILASLDNGYILDGEQAALQDSNDHFLANIQKDGTYSVVPRVPGGEITPEGLIAIGEVARDFDLYTKITGGQRIDLFGARVEQLPVIWRRLVDAGFESGHAYGKSLRTVKSCVGSNWCRYGVQDSTAMAILLEERYRGIRSPHKIKMAVSGCARECAEAQSKDVGVIATEKGWNLWVGGNGGMRPRHAELLAEDLDDESLIRSIDRFVELYVRSADRLQRTASWIEALDGGIDHVRAVVMDDSLGLGAELEEAMEAHVAAYECEWAATLEDPQRLARFVTFVNAPDEPDPTVVFVRERHQIRPARPDELVGAMA